MRTIPVLAALILLSLLPVSTRGEQRHRFHLDHTDGLSNNFVRGIAQDNYGFVWIATIDGLNRFDGRKFTMFTKEDSGLTSNELNSIVADPSNPDIVWIGSRKDGLCKYDYTTGQISQCKEDLKSTDIPCLKLSSDNKIWVVYYHFPPERYNSTTGEIERLYDAIPSGFKTNSMCAVEDASGKYLYIGHDGDGLTQVNLENKRFRNFQPSSSGGNAPSGSHIYSLHIDSKGDVWCGTENGLSIYSPYSGSFLNIEHSGNSSLPPGTVKSICELANGDIWIGTDKGGVCVLSAEKYMSGIYSFEELHTSSQFNSQEDMSSPFISKIFEDSFGNVWIGTQSNGLDIISYEAPFFLQEKPFPVSGTPRVSQAVWSTTTDSDGNLWLGGENCVLRMNKDSQTPYMLPITPVGNTTVSALHYAKNGILWIGTANSGVFTFNPSLKQFSPVGINEKEIRCFEEDKDGNILIGTHGGIYRCSDKSTAHLDNDLTPLLPDRYVMSMLYDKTGKLWVGSYGKGVAVISPQMEVAKFSQDDILPSNTINDIYEDSKGNVWFATRTGAFRIAKDNYSDFSIYNNDNGLLNNDVKGIVEDKNGNIWLSTNKGVGHLDTSSGILTTYGKTYGKDLFSYTEGSVSGNDNRIFFGSLNGLTHFNPLRLDKENRDSKVMVSEISANDRNAEDQNVEIMIPVNSDKIKLPYNLNTFTIKFCNPDITQAANSDYVYNMEGVNEVWTPVNDENEAVYRSLRPGEYQFRIRHRLNGQEWSAPEILATITITPPFYLAWWAKMLYVISAVILVTLIIYFYKHKIELEKNLTIEKENSKNNQLMNEERMVFFTNITHELRTPLTLIIGPIEDLVNDTDIKPEQRRKLLTIRTSSMRLLNLINGILEFRKTETHNKKLEVVYGNFANFIREIGIRFKELNNNPDQTINIDVADLEGFEMYYDPEMITIILNNLLGNAIKYTKAGTITLALHLTMEGGVRYVDLSVSDTGEGISKEALPHIFERYYQAKHNRKVSGTGIGLSLSKNLVELHEGTISVQSEEGVGSTFTVRLIADNSYPNAMHREVEESYEDRSVKDELSLEKDDRLSILVVEDDDDVREYISQSLSDEFKVYTAADGKEGFDKALEVYPDIIVSDVMMPVMDGIELCGRIKSDTAISHVPVILLTAKDSLLDKEQGYSAGADSYITKPFSANLLKARITNILETRHKLTLRMLEEEDEGEENVDNCNILINNDITPRK